MCIAKLSYQVPVSRRADPVSGDSGDLNAIRTDSALNTGIIERFCFLLLSCKPAAHAGNTEAPLRVLCLSAM